MAKTSKTKLNIKDLDKVAGGKLNAKPIEENGAKERLPREKPLNPNAF